MDQKKVHWASPLGHFTAHALVASVVFVIIAVPAVALGQLVKWLATNGATPYVLQVLTLLEYAIVTIDAVAFFCHLVYSTYKALKEMIWNQ